MILVTYMAENTLAMSPWAINNGGSTGGVADCILRKQGGKNRWSNCQLVVS